MHLCRLAFRSGYVQVERIANIHFFHPALCLFFLARPAESKKILSNKMTDVDNCHALQQTTDDSGKSLIIGSNRRDEKNEKKNFCPIELDEINFSNWTRLAACLKEAKASSELVVPEAADPFSAFSYAWMGGLFLVGIICLIVIVVVRQRTSSATFNNEEEQEI